MQFIKSLFCVKGFDNRHRFLMISALSYLTFLVVNAAFNPQIWLIITFLLILVMINGLTSLRRLNDAQLNKSWLLGPSISFFISSLVIIFINHNSLYWLLLIPCVFSALLLTYPSKNNVSYILGYYGPIDLGEFAQETSNSHRQSQRIEPTILGNKNTTVQEAFNSDPLAVSSPLSSDNTLDQNSLATYPQNNTSTNKSQQDIGEIIRLKLLSNKNALITLIVIFSLIISAVVISIILSSFEQNNDEMQPIEVVKEKAIRLSAITLPDNFSLMLSKHQGLIIHWQADSTEKEELWSITTATGEQKCQEIVFNKGDKYRTTTVVVEDKTEYFANFSPLDTKALLQAIAFRGSFSLCDYKFSLKGSQAVLGKHSEYADIVEY